MAALIDSERASPDAALSAARQGFVSSCASLGITCHVLDRRATENYFTEAAIQRVKGNRYTALPPYTKVEDAALGWGKSENWRIAREMSLQDLAGTDLLTFLQSL